MSPDERNKRKISSEGLAALIIDALCDAKIIADADVSMAIEIAEEEINARKAMNDY